MTKDLEKISKILHSVMTEEEISTWINTSHPDLDNCTPVSLICMGKVEIIVDMLEDMLLGHPN